MTAFQIGGTGERKRVSGSDPAKDKQVCGVRYYYSAVEYGYRNRSGHYNSSAEEVIHVIEQPSWADDNTTVPLDLIFSPIKEDRNIKIRTMLLDNRYLVENDEYSIQPDLNLTMVGGSCSFSDVYDRCDNFLNLVRKPECASCLQSVQSKLHKYTEVERCANRGKCFPMREAEDIKKYTYDDGSSTSWPMPSGLHQHFVKNWTCVEKSDCDSDVNPGGILKKPNDERFLDPEGCAARWDNTDLVSTVIKECAMTSGPEEVECYTEHIQLPVDGEDYQHPQMSLIFVYDGLDNIRNLDLSYDRYPLLLGEVNWIYEGEEGCPLAPSATPTATPTATSSNPHTRNIDGASLLVIIW
eukprot:CAMPEP_0194354772 /NCGR_PEP_ID=MMETSP0174-20130528/2817_1 /TAXON_ID=216777 /ORGANISM="Proboscia alata, Strain PI-D3" /LENGTH=353 /DNA_ID=CAMNT_0039123797 /DNA_START=117 /DNA_END=1175 /DNA_ORIENTATION=-